MSDPAPAKRTSSQTGDATKAAPVVIDLPLDLLNEVSSSCATYFVLDFRAGFFSSTGISMQPSGPCLLNPMELSPSFSLRLLLSRSRVHANLSFPCPCLIPLVGIVDRPNLNRFINGSLFSAFDKLLFSNETKNWKPNIQVTCLFRSSM